MLLFFEGYGQNHLFKLTGGPILTHTKVQLFDADEGFRLKNYRVGYKFGLTYEQFLHNKGNLGIRTGLQLAKKRYCIHLSTVQSYEEINGSAAELDLDLKTYSNYQVVELPLTLLYRKSLVGLL